MRLYVVIVVVILSMAFGVGCKRAKGGSETGSGTGVGSGAQVERATDTVGPDSSEGSPDTSNPDDTLASGALPPTDTDGEENGYGSVGDEDGRFTDTGDPPAGDTSTIFDNPVDDTETETDLCLGIVCDEPPSPFCVNDDVLLTHRTPGMCTNGVCTFTAMEIFCEWGCEKGACLMALDDAGTIEAGDPDNDTGSPKGIDTSACTPDHGPSEQEDWIANFEPGTLQAGNGIEEFAGFYAVNDQTPGARMLPDHLSDHVGDASTDVEACSTAMMCVMNTAGTFDTWGVRVEMHWDEDPSYLHESDGKAYKLPRDLSEYRGIAFYALRRGGESSVAVGFPDLNTHPHGSVCEADGNDTGCYNDWSTVILLIEENVWTRHEILFEDLTISNSWGLQPDSFHQEAVFGMNFMIGERSDFNFCVDEIYLFR